MRTQPLVSVVVAVKNETVLLKKCVNDLLAQTYSSLEIIIADDGSHAETKEILAGFDDERVKVVTLPTSKGQSAARNLAFEHVTGHYVAIADADDRYHPERIEQQLDFMEIHPHIDVCGSDFTVNKGAKPWEIHYHHPEIYHRFLINNPFVHSSLFFKAELLENGFKYRTTYDTAEDYDVLATHRNQWFFHNLNRPLLQYFVRERKPEAIENQRSKARKIREKILKEYLDDFDEFEAQIHHDFCDLRTGLGYREIKRWTGRLMGEKFRDDDSLKIFRKVLSRHEWIYIRKCYPVGYRKRDKLKTLYQSRFKPFYTIKSAIKIILSRPL